MVESADSQDIPTYYANFVTSQINVDELSMEFRRLFIPHREMALQEAKDGIVPVPPVTGDRVMKLEPIARVVLTFSAAKALRDYLDKVLPSMEAQRTKGQTG